MAPEGIFFFHFFLLSFLCMPNINRPIKFTSVQAGIYFTELYQCANLIIYLDNKWHVNLPSRTKKRCMLTASFFLQLMKIVLRLDSWQIACVYKFGDKSPKQVGCQQMAIIVSQVNEQNLKQANTLTPCNHMGYGWWNPWQTKHWGLSLCAEC